MGVARDNHVDGRVKRFVNCHNRSGDADTGVHIAGRRRLRTTFVQQHDDGIDALRFQDRYERVGRLGLVQEIPALDAGSRDQRVRRLERHADEADLDALDPAHPVGRQRCLTGRVDDIGRQPLEVGAGKRGIREVAAVDGMAAAVLHAQQLGHAFVKLVVADAGHVQPHRVQRLDGRFVVKEPGKGRRAANQVARGDGQAVLVALSQLGELGRKIFRATRGLALKRAGRARLKVPVIVVEGQQLELDELTRRIRRSAAVARGRVHGRDEQQQGREQRHTEQCAFHLGILLLNKVTSCI